MSIGILVVEMRYNDATNNRQILSILREHAGFAQAQGFSCLGTWRKDECLELCEQLRGRDLSVRALPGVRGRQAWQGEPANTSPDALPSAP